MGGVLTLKRLERQLLGPESMLTIYLAEDDDEDALLFALALSTSHPTSQLLRFTNGDDLLKSLTKDDRPEPLIIFLDLFMPVRSGFETLTQIRQLPHLSQVPVAVLTGSESQHDSKQSFQMDVLSIWLNRLRFRS